MTFTQPTGTSATSTPAPSAAVQAPQIAAPPVTVAASATAPPRAPSATASASLAASATTTLAAQAPAAPAPPAPPTHGGHLHHDPNARATNTTDAAWLRMSAAWSGHVADLSGRDDLLVVVAPGAGQGAPACFIPTLACVEVDATHLHTDPNTVDPYDPDARDRYPVAWGLLIHEAAHARHTRWASPAQLAGVPDPVAQAAMLLEESRIEAAQLRRRPGDRRYLRATVTTLLLDDIDDVDTPEAAGTTAALLLARADARVLAATEVRAARTVVRAILGTDKLRRLTQVWRAAHKTRDDDTQAMLDLARAWCHILDIHTSGTTAGQQGQLGQQGQPSPSSPGSASPPLPPAGAGAGAGGGASTGGKLRKAAGTVVKRVTANDRADAQAEADAKARATAAANAGQRARAAEQHAQRNAHGAAGDIFGKLQHGSPGTPVPTRAATDPERATARQLSRAMKLAAARDPIVTTVTSATPPGRLIARAAVTAAAQRAAGMRPDTEPWRATRQQRVPSPPIQVGISVDVSTSMRSWIGPLASAAWITAQATAWAGGRSATVTFGRQVTAVTRPGQPTAHVRIFPLEGSTRGFPESVAALDGALGLADPRAGARLLIVVSDGDLMLHEKQDGQRHLDRLRAAGCALLWLGPVGSTPLAGVHALIGTPPADAAAAIAKAATAALAGHRPITHRPTP